MTVRELFARMDSAEFTEWMAYNEIEPFGDEWRPSATVAAILANANSTGTTFHAEDFMPVKSTPQTTSVTAQQLIEWAKSHGNNHKPSR
jgi:hypothetical protein